MEIKNTKQISISFLTSMFTLFSLFLYTMIINYKEFDAEYLLFATPRIIAISLVPALLAIVLKVTSYIKSISIGIVVSFISAVIYLRVTNAI